MEILKAAVQMFTLLVIRNYYGYVIVLPMASITENIVTAYLAKRYYPQYVCQGSVSPQLKKNIKEKTMALVGVKITSLIYNSVDSVVISSFLGLVVLAQYNNYYYIMQALITIISAAYNSVMAIVGNNIVTQSTEKNYSDYMNLSFLNAWMIGWCTVCLYCLYQPFMLLWVGSELMFDTSVTICFCVYFYVFQLKAVQSTYKDAAGLWKEDLYRSYATNLFNLVSNLILVQVIGVYGILLSTIFALLVVSYPWQTKMIHQKLFHCRHGAVSAAVGLLYRCNHTGMCRHRHRVRFGPKHGFCGAYTAGNHLLRPAQHHLPGMFFPAERISGCFGDRQTAAAPSIILLKDIFLRKNITLYKTPAWPHENHAAGPAFCTASPAGQNFLSAQRLRYLGIFSSWMVLPWVSMPTITLKSST